jgi:hypothetical protein
MAYEDDIAELSAKMKKLNDDSKREGAERLSKSSSKADRAMAEGWKKDLANDTATMSVTREGYGRRIGADGKPTGPELRKGDDGKYMVEKKAKGGMTGSSASRRADGIASKGKTRGKFL